MTANAMTAQRAVEFLLEGSHHGSRWTPLAPAKGHLEAVRLFEAAKRRFPAFRYFRMKRGERVIWRNIR